MIRTLLGALLFAPLGARAGEVARPPTALDDDAYRFCHVPGANASQARRWCELLDELPPGWEERCPGLRETCAGTVSQDPVPCGEMPRSGTSEPNKLAGAPEKPPPERQGCDDAGCDQFERGGLQNLLRWMAALAVAALVAVVLRLVWATFGRRSDPKTAPLVEISPEALDPAEDLPDVPSEDLLDRARRALAENRPEETVLLARAAALRRLGEAGRIRLHRSRTDREYVRSLRAEPQLQQELREIVSSAEAVRWAGHREDIAAPRVLAAAERLVAAVRKVFLALLLLGLASEQARAQSRERYYPEGDAALFDILVLYGHEAGWRLRNLVELDDSVDVVFVDLSAVSLAPEHWSHIRDWVTEGGILVVGGDATGGLPELGPLVPLDPERALEVEPAFARAGLPLPRWPASDLGPRGYTGSGRLLVGTRDPDVAAVQLLDLGAGVVVAIADPEILWNGAFVHPDNERFVGELIYAGQAIEGWPTGVPARVQLATWAAASDPESNGANNPLGALAQAGLLAFLLQLLLTWGLAALWRGRPFAPLRDPPEEGRAAFSEHIQALGTRYWRLGATRHAARASAALWLARLGPRGLQLAAQRAGYDAAQARAWAERIEALAHSDPADDSQVDPAEMEELWRLTSEHR